MLLHMRGALGVLHAYMAFKRLDLQIGSSNEMHIYRQTFPSLLGWVAGKDLLKPTVALGPGYLAAGRCDNTSYS